MSQAASCGIELLIEHLHERSCSESSGLCGGETGMLSVDGEHSPHFETWETKPETLEQDASEGVSCLMTLCFVRLRPDFEHDLKAPESRGLQSGKASGSQASVKAGKQWCSCSSLSSVRLACSTWKPWKCFMSLCKMPAGVSRLQTLKTSVL